MTENFTENFDKQKEYEPIHEELIAIHDRLMELGIPFIFAIGHGYTRDDDGKGAHLSTAVIYHGDSRFAPLQMARMAVDGDPRLRLGMALMDRISNDLGMVMLSSLLADNKDGVDKPAILNFLEKIMAVEPEPETTKDETSDETTDQGGTSP